ncbi:phage tail-collar fiber domain-containing protein [Pantoea agglomerans]|uniref:phage tail-collar fiber domain-containing protein n=1 Tax=Enterobacter agglomerans TaxID=549 RepID=UPI003DA0E9B3
MSYGLVLTNAGAVEIETAYHAGSTVEIVRVALGDGGGTALPDTPADLAQVMQLAGQFGSEAFSGAETAEGMISGRVVIPCATYPGKTLREVGLVSASDTLIAYGIYPETYIPDEGAAVLKEITIRMVLALTHAESVSIQVDPYVSIITQDSGDARYLQRQKNLADLDDLVEALKNLGAYPMAGGYLNEDASATVISQTVSNLPSGQAIYSPMWRATINGRGGDMDFADGASACFRLVEVIGNYAYAEILVDGFGVVKSFEFRNDGSLHAPSSVYAGGAFIAPDGNVYGSVWGGYQNQWILAQINALNVALNNQITASINNNNSGWVLPNFQLKNTANLGSGWEKDSATGRIRQWGFLNAGATTGFFQVNFPITFPNACANVQVTVVNGGGSKFADNYGTAGNVTQSGFTCGQDTGGSYWEAIGW